MLLFFLTPTSLKEVITIFNNVSDFRANGTDGLLSEIIKLNALYTNGYLFPKLRKNSIIFLFSKVAPILIQIITALFLNKQFFENY